MEQTRPKLEVVVSNEKELDELIQDPKVYGDAIKFLIKELRSSREILYSIIWKGDVFDVEFIF
jgi:hypothetical protein